ncbi:hypothetical protein [Acinetobacter bereziniae]|jgi:hypothetical protein|uniref:hypothetical protein n=2 Tax=Acinetobacter bereziniae TaxID=106648 RepID=UPI0005740D44|nr:hypothetical protein [Acinetobacter bereziniae]MDA3440364.1 hypothetical protein [Acinetobacter bereziniae]CEI52824.1 hypothetical protein [Acinetobacter bereziniae]
MYFVYSGTNPFENSDLTLKSSIDDFIYESIFVNHINLKKYPSIKREFFLDKNDDYETIAFFNNEIDVILENLNNYLKEFSEDNLFEEKKTLKDLIFIMQDTKKIMKICILFIKN